MSTMQSFHSMLTQAPEIHDPYFQALAQLKQASRSLVESTSLEWDYWAVDPA